MDDKEYKKFNAREYLHLHYPQSLFDKPDPNVSTIYKLSCYNKFYQQFHKEWDSSTARMLDLGGGPSVHCLISASPYVAVIDHSDFVQTCRDEVLLWKKNDPNAYDWSPYFRYVVNTLEGLSGPEAVAERMKMTRDKLEDVLLCDVKCANSVLPGNDGKRYDLIFSISCIENVVESVEEYGRILVNVKSLLNPNGFFVTIVNLDCSYYTVDGKNYPCFPISQEDVIKSMEAVGFKIMLVEYSRNSEVTISNNPYHNSAGKGFFVARLVSHAPN